MISWPRFRQWVAVLALVALIAGVRSCLAPAPAQWGPGAVVTESPDQRPTSRPGFSVEVGDRRVEVAPVAEFSVRARVLGVKRYRGSSLEDRLSPLDLALGWQGMSDEAVLEQLAITQSGRWYFYRWQDAPPLPLKDIIRSSANMHLVPASDQVVRDLMGVRKGDVVVLEGALVNLRAKGWWWRTSTRRDDTGDGSCELVWVERVRVEPPPRG